MGRRAIATRSQSRGISMYTSEAHTAERIMDYQPAKLVSGFVVIARKPLARSHRIASAPRLTSRRLAFVCQQPISLMLQETLGNGSGFRREP